MKKWLVWQKEDLILRLKSYPKVRLLIFWSVISGLWFSFVILWPRLTQPTINNFDLQISRLIINWQTPKIIVFFKAITFLGEDYFIFLFYLVLAFILITKNRKRAALVTLLILIGNSFISVIVRQFFGRARPNGCINDLFGTSCYSFPSGHTVLSVYFYGLITYLIYRFASLTKSKFYLVAIGLTILIFLIGLSRLILGVHYPSDIVAGVLFGGGWLVLAIWLIDLLY